MSAPGLQGLLELLEADLLVLDFLAKHPAQHLRGLLVAVLDRAEQRVHLAFVRRGIFEDADNHASHVIGGNRGVSAGAERDVKQPLADHRGDIEEPLGEVCGPDVGDRHAGPVEDPLGQPVKCRSMALRVLSGGNLRHVHDAIDAGFLRRLGELGRRLDDPRADGVDEVGPLDAAQRGRTWSKSRRSP